jgi:hypothetical protein
MSSSTLVTGVETVTRHVSVIFLSTVVTVIVAVPFEIAVTRPPATVATEELLLDHATFVFEAFEGRIVAVSVELPPGFRLNVSTLSETPVTATLLWPPQAVANSRIANEMMDRKVRKWFFIRIPQ